MESFWDLKFSVKYVEYLVRVSSEYLTNSVLSSLGAATAELHVLSRLT